MRKDLLEKVMYHGVYGTNKYIYKVVEYGGYGFEHRVRIIRTSRYMYEKGLAEWETIMDKKI